MSNTIKNTGTLSIQNNNSKGCIELLNILTLVYGGEVRVRGKKSKKLNPWIRLWKDVYIAYRDVAKKHNLTITDLVSTILFSVTLESPLTVMAAVMDFFDIDKDKAREIAYDLYDRLFDLIEEGEVEETEKEREEVIEEAPR